MIFIIFVLCFYTNIFNNIIIFERSIFIFVRYNGRWHQNNLYINHKTMGVQFLSKQRILLQCTLYEDCNAQSGNTSSKIKKSINLRQFQGYHNNNSFVQ